MSNPMENRLTSCTRCGGSSFDAHEELLTRTVGGYRFRMRVSAQRCRDCKEVFFTAQEVASFDLQVAERLMEMGTKTGLGFKFARKAVGLRAADLAALLDVDVATISRWENDKIPIDRAALATLGSLVRDKRQGSSATMAQLRALREAQAPSALSVEL